jgi:hypothetical protein
MAHEDLVGCVLAAVFGAVERESIRPVAGPVSVLPAGVDLVGVGRIVALLAVAQDSQDCAGMFFFQIVVVCLEILRDFLDRSRRRLGPAVLEFLAELLHVGNLQVGSQHFELGLRGRHLLLGG